MSNIKIKKDKKEIKSVTNYGKNDISMMNKQHGERVCDMWINIKKY